MRKLSDWLAVGPSVDDSWQAFLGCHVLIFVGLTGVGKSTTLDELSALGVNFLLLPNRRTITDDLIIGALQLADGESITTVADREQRFAYTRRYREQYAGGMAHALTQLFIKPDAAQLDAARLDATRADAFYIFDGLRGENEVSYAAQHMPHARFVVLTASDFVRVQRLIKRNDQFDVISGDAPAQTMAQTPSMQDLFGEAASLFTKDEQPQLYQLVETGAVSAEELAAKLKIVAAERRNYDQDASRAALQKLAPDRTLVVDTSLYSPPEVARQIAAFVPSGAQK